MILLGLIIRFLVCLILLLDLIVVLFFPSLLAADMTATGFPMSLHTPTGIVLLVCGVLYAIPRTSPLGAILLSAFFGGAICTHFRVGEMGSPPQLVAAAIAIAAWAGLWLSDARVKTLVDL